MLGNLAASARRFGIDGQRKARGKGGAAFDRQAERQPQRSDLGKACRAEFGKAEAQIAQAEQRIAVRVEFGNSQVAAPTGLKNLTSGA